VDELLFYPLEIWNTTSLLQQLLVFRQSLKNVSLAQRKANFTILVVVADHKILYLLSLLGIVELQIVESHTSSPHRRTSRSLPFALRHVVSNCYEPALEI
jgi:hypothetical protein